MDVKKVETVLISIIQLTQFKKMAIMYNCV